MSGVRLDGIRPRLAERYLSMSLAVERLSRLRARLVAPDSDLGTMYPVGPCPAASRALRSGVSVIRVLSIFKGWQILSTTSDS